jgi:hypothetical protein
MKNLIPLRGKTLTHLEGLPARSPEELLEDVARELMTVAAALRSAELRTQPPPSEVVKRAKQALAAVTPEVRKALHIACEPATLVELGERITALVQSIPHGEPPDGYCAALTIDVGSLEPSRGALEAACRWLRTSAMFRPKIPEVLAAVREAGILYEAASGATDELQGQIARAQLARADQRKVG